MEEKLRRKEEEREKEREVGNRKRCETDRERRFPFHHLLKFLSCFKTYN